MCTYASAGPIKGHRRLGSIPIGRKELAGTRSREPEPALVTPVAYPSGQRARRRRSESLHDGNPCSVGSNLAAKKPGSLRVVCASMKVTMFSGAGILMKG